MNSTIIIVLIVIWTLILMKISLSQKKRKDELFKTDRDQFKKQRQIDDSSKKSISDIENERQNFIKIQDSKKNEFERLLKEAVNLRKEFEKGYLNGRNWLSDAFSEYIKMKDNELECSLIIKPNPAYKSAEIVSALKQSRYAMAKKLNFLEYQLKSYEEYFPQLLEYKNAILEEIIDVRNGTIDSEDIDPALLFGYITKEEYTTLTNQQKFQLAIDRYWKKDKSHLEIGRLYERFVGYIFESEGWKVKYEGIIKGYEDFGRDLICEKDRKYVIVQCKCWSKEKLIREKYIMQLFGSTILYEYENSVNNVVPIFYATTSLSEEAILVANKLNVKIAYEPMKKYPIIKCNINHANKEKIYHLPFDQQYDKIIIGDIPGEFYAYTIKEAEDMGFRRAYKWAGN
jgi:hypothetical protein